ncbi:MAG: type VI secretion system baseplate subunit TssF [Planctomycetaceae bacterium]|nr:type VI secretion system baseplate subunit TssF [Planctomycetaceae bacterium]
MTEELLTWYNSELASIRQLGDEFARAYPRIAGRLRLSSSSSDDPHVERLIEAFAFLTARVRNQLEDDFPQITESMLEILHPHILAPLPPLSVMQFELDSSAGKLTGGYEIPRHSQLDSEPVDGEPCRFRTCYPVTLWPLRLLSATLSGPPFRAPETHASADAQSVLSLRLQCLNSQLPPDRLGLSSLRFFLNGQRHYIDELYELLFNNLTSVAVAKDAKDPSPRVLDRECVRTVGFENGQDVLPHSPRTPHAYQLLREFFAFPEKFLFFDLDSLDQGLAGWDSPVFEVFFYFNRHVEELEQYVSAETFRMGCTPIVNLFDVTAEPIRVTHEKPEYQVVPDSRRPAALEIFSINSVVAVDEDGQHAPVRPLYSMQHGNSSQTSQFWTASRRAGKIRDGQLDPGTDLHLSLVDLGLNPADSQQPVLHIETTCLNRDLVSRLPFGGDHPRFHLEKTGPVGRMTCLLHPTRTRRMNPVQGTLWRVISHLSLNHLSIEGGADGAETLRELLQVYDTVRNPDEPFPLHGILSVSSRRIVSRVSPRQAAGSLRSDRSVEPGFGRGVEIRVELDEDRFVGSGLFLFATVLLRFFARQCTVNSFTRMVLGTRQRKEIRRWPPRTGNRLLH